MFALSRLQIFAATIISVMGALAGACAGPPSADFNSTDGAARMQAIRDAAATSDEAQIPQLIRRLDSDDPGERLLAIRTLERLTGQTQGFDYAAPRVERDAAVGRWVQWSQQQGGTGVHG